MLKMKNKITMGPWQAKHQRGGNIWVKADDGQGETVALLTNIKNASLISAAPELLDACEQALEELSEWHNTFRHGCTDCGTCLDAMPMLATAIAKARGGATP